MHAGRRDLPVSMHPSCPRGGVHSRPVVRVRLHPNRSGSGDPALQGLARERWRGTGFPTALCEGRRFFIVARGPVPRELHRHDVYSPSVVCNRLITNGSGSGDPALQGLARERWRGEPARHARVEPCEGPSPTMKGAAFFHRSAGPVPATLSEL